MTGDFTIEQTERGFDFTAFTDMYRQKCSLQKSSLATEDAIWLGVDVDMKGKDVNQRMHLSQKMVKELLPFLRNFVKTGDIICTK